MLKRFILLALLIIVLAACNINGPEPTATSKVELLPSPLPSTSTPNTVPSPSATVPPTATEVILTETPAETPAPTATQPPQSYGPDNFPSDIDPLTGLRVSDPTILDRRPISIKIQNFPRGERPAFGISLADLVFDYYSNNGATRFNAVFYGKDAERVSPIRSARLLDMIIVRTYKAIFAFGGADERILTPMLNSEFADRLIIGSKLNCPAICRVDPNGYNFLVANTRELSKFATSKGISNKRQNLNGMTFDTRTPAVGKPATQVFARYNKSAYVRWDYDATAGRYLRFQDAETDNGQGEKYAPFMDGLTKQQVAADNVVVLYVTHENTVKSNVSEVIDIQLYGSGKAYAFRDGQEYELKWNRPDQTSMLVLTFPDGKAYPLKPGNTWFQVLGQSSKFEIKDASAWHFTFKFP